MNETYRKKYLKYKNKYYNIQKNKLSGGDLITTTIISVILLIIYSYFGYQYLKNYTNISTYYKVLENTKTTIETPKKTTIETPKKATIETPKKLQKINDDDSFILLDHIRKLHNNM